MLGCRAGSQAAGLLHVTTTDQGWPQGASVPPATKVLNSMWEAVRTHANLDLTISHIVKTKIHFRLQWRLITSTRRRENQALLSKCLIR